jgi:hypothetical protein
MTIVLKKGVPTSDIDKKINSEKVKQKLHDFEKYAGLITLNEDPLIIQKKLRNEWE